ncbi:MAG TPA: hypothetical protein PKM41_11400 [Deltaproteobacteria bacterium]|nr:hypothetical protein [Deltaproteobacteria bacterium]HOI08228.1 hypothetical protein [Deltaproteobacteria bacterium]
MKLQSYILKVTDAKKADIRKALKEAGIEVRAITEIYTEDAGEGKDAEKKADGNG